MFYIFVLRYPTNLLNNFQVAQLKAYLANPEAFAAAAAPVAVAETAAVEEKKESSEEESDDDMGFDMFG